MSEEIKIDLGDGYGFIVVSSSTSGTGLEDPGLVQVGISESIRQTSEKVVTAPAALLQRALTGLAYTFAASLPTKIVAEHYELDTFTVEFNMGLATEIGSTAPVVLKIAADGSFKCAYTWKRVS